MKFHFSSSRGETKNNFSSRISRDRDSCQGLIPGAANINRLEPKLKISPLLYLDHDVLVFMPRDALLVWNYRNQDLQSETLVLLMFC